MIALPLQVNSNLIASQNEEFNRYETFHTPAASRRTISRAARSCSSAERVPNFFGAGRRFGASLLIKPNRPSLLNKTPVTQRLASCNLSDSLRAAKSNGTHRNPQRETRIAGNSGSNSAHAPGGFFTTKGTRRDEKKRFVIANLSFVIG